MTCVKFLLTKIHMCHVPLIRILSDSHEKCSNYIILIIRFFATYDLIVFGRTYCRTYLSNTNVGRIWNLIWFRFSRDKYKYLYKRKAPRRNECSFLRLEIWLWFTNVNPSILRSGIRWSFLRMWSDWFWDGWGAWIFIELGRFVLLGIEFGENVCPNLIRFRGWSCSRIQNNADVVACCTIPRKK